MQDLDPTRRTTLKVLALLGVGAAGSTGFAAADEHDGDGEDDHHGDDHDGHHGGADASGLYVAHLEPEEGVETNARGVAAVQQRQDGLKFVVGVSNLENALMAHIHEDEVLGPIAVWLYDFATQAERLEEGQFSGLLDVGTITDEVIAAGRVPEAESQTVDDLLGKISAGEAYVNVHTEAHPSGEIAGRLVPFDPSTVMGHAPHDADSKPAHDDSANDSEAEYDDEPTNDSEAEYDEPENDSEAADNESGTDDDY